MIYKGYKIHKAKYGYIVLHAGIEYDFKLLRSAKMFIRVVA